MSLVVSCDDDINFKKECKTQIISMIMENAENLGWNVEKTKKNVYTLRKKENKLTKKEQNTSKLIDMILDIRNFA
jgi:hypothetical protein